MSTIANDFDKGEYENNDAAGNYDFIKVITDLEEILYDRVNEFELKFLNYIKSKKLENFLELLFCENEKKKRASTCLVAWNWLSARQERLA